MRPARFAELHRQRAGDAAQYPSTPNPPSNLEPGLPLLIGTSTGGRSQAAKDLDSHENVMRKWVRELRDEPQEAFPGNGKQKAQDAEVAQLRKEVAELKMERDIPKKPRPTSRRSRCEVRVRGETPGGPAGRSNVRGARRLVGWPRDTARRGGAASAMKCWARRPTRASYTATAPMAHAVCGTRCWSKVRLVVCTALNGSCANRHCEPDPDGIA